MISLTRSLRLVACTFIMLVLAVFLTGESAGSADLSLPPDSLGTAPLSEVGCNTAPLEYAGSALWGGTQDVVFYHKWVICAMQEGFVMINTRSPFSQDVKRQLYPDGMVRPFGLARSGSNLFVGVRETFSTQNQRVLAAFDISNPAAPVLRGYLYNTYGPDLHGGKRQYCRAE